jgi:hypothetical protein
VAQNQAQAAQRLALLLLGPRAAAAAAAGADGLRC